MFQYVLLCKRRVRIGLLLLICLLIWISLRNPSFLSFLQNKQSVLVPNIIHFIHFIDIQKLANEDNIDDLNFVSATCILAVAFNQKPEKIIIHTNGNLTLNLANKKYWSLVFRILNPKQIKQKGSESVKRLVKPFNTTLKVVHLRQPTHVFGQPLSSAFHAADVARLNVLLNEGGIALDQDTFIVKKLDPSFFQEEKKVTLGNNSKFKLKILFQYKIEKDS